MNTGTVICGALFIFYGTLVLFFRLTGREEKLKKLAFMKEKLGERAAGIVHGIFYIVLPMVLGGVIVFLGLKGLNLIQVISY